MKLPENVRQIAVRFNQRSLRERALIAAASLGALIMLWTVLFLDPVNARERMLRDEMASLQESIDSGVTQMEEVSGAARAREALARIESLEAERQHVDAELISKSAGLIPPPLMVQVIHDVLRHQQSLKLVSLHNKAVMPLVQPVAPEQVPPAETGDEQPTAPAPVVAESGPYVHPVELVIEGSYLDVLRYLQALEASPWRFYWKVLDLETVRYPLNRVRIELTTLSMDKEWVGV